MTLREETIQRENDAARIRMMEACELVAELGALFQLNPDAITPSSIKHEVLRLKRAAEMREPKGANYTVPA